MKALVIFAALCSTAAACPQGVCDSQQIVERVVVPQRVYVQQQRVERVIVKERVQRQRVQRNRGFSLKLERNRH
jgi:hypothetical protein